MANYRNIHCQIWRDPWFMDLSGLERYFFIYLFSNEASSMCGLYPLDMRIISFETGLTDAAIKDALAKFEAGGKAYYRDGVVWVVNMQKYNALNTASPKVQARITSDLALVPADHPLLIAYHTHHGGDGYPIDKVSIPDPSVSVSVSSTPTDTPTPTGSAAAAESDERETPPPLTDPLVGEVYTAWHNANGLLNRMHRDILSEYIDEYGAENVRDAIKEGAAVQSSFGPRYVEAILRNWRTNGRNSGKARASPDNGEPVYRTALAEWVAEGEGESWTEAKSPD